MLPSSMLPPILPRAFTTLTLPPLKATSIAVSSACPSSRLAKALGDKADGPGAKCRLPLEGRSEVDTALRK